MAAMTDCQFPACPNPAEWTATATGVAVCPDHLAWAATRAVAVDEADR